MLKTLELECPAKGTASATAELNGKRVKADVSTDGSKRTITFSEPLMLEAGSALKVTCNEK
jgi:hypothetical protein